MAYYFFLLKILQGMLTGTPLMKIYKTFILEKMYFYAYFACSKIEKKNGFRDIGEKLIFLLNFNTSYLRNKAVADLCSYKEFFLKSSKDYRPLGSAFNYETPFI